MPVRQTTGLGESRRPPVLKIAVLWNDEPVPGMYCTFGYVVDISNWLLKV
jgi:hypothetical protein